VFNQTCLSCLIKLFVVFNQTVCRVSTWTCRRSDLQQPGVLWAPYLEVPVAKRQWGVDLWSLQVGHLEVFREYRCWVSVTMDDIAGPGGGASWCLGHMIHDECQRRKLSDEGELEKEEQTEKVNMSWCDQLNDHWSALHLEGFCGHLAWLRPHRRDLSSHRLTRFCVNNMSIRGVDDDTDDRGTQLLRGVKDD